MQPTIDTARYVWAFETWSSLAKLQPFERELVRGALEHLRSTHQGVHPIQHLCDAFLRWLEAGAHPEPLRRMLLNSIGKSCLLDRLIYAGEPLRKRPCPVHRGHWSGYWKDAPCAEGCAFGPSNTGWLAEGLSSTARMQP